MKRMYLTRRLLAGVMSAALAFSAVPAGLASAEEAYVEDDYAEALLEADFLMDDANEAADEEILFDAGLEEAPVVEEAFQEAAVQAYDDHAAGYDDQTVGYDDLTSVDGLIEDPDAAPAEDAVLDTQDEMEEEEAQEITNLLAEKLPVSFFANATALSLNTEYSVTIAETGDYGLYSFVPAATAHYKFDSYESTAAYTGGMIIVLYNASGEAIYYDDCDAGEKDYFSLEARLEAGKTYYIRVAASDALYGFSFKFKAEKLTEWLTAYEENDEFHLGAVNSGATLTALVDASPAPSYKWYRDYVSSSNIIPGAIDSSYATGPIAEDTVFILVVSNSSGSIPLVFSVYVSPFSATRAEGLSDYMEVKPGDTLELGVVASGSYGYSYNWEIDDEPASEYSDIGLTVKGSTTSDKLSLIFNTADHFGISCRVEDVTGYSQYVYFNIRVKDFSLEYDGSVEVSRGASHTMEVRVLDVPAGAGIQYQWYNDEDYELSGDPGAPNCHTLTNIQSEDYYRCEVTVNGVTRVAYFSVDVYDDSFGLEHISDISVLLHGSATMKVTPVGDYQGPVTYKWYFIPYFTVGSYVKLPGQTSDTLVIEDVLEEQAYICMATDSRGRTAYANFYLIEADHEHNWVAGAVYKQASCTESGQQIFKCSICGSEKMEPIPASGHSWGAWTKVSDATVFAPASQIQTCQRCGASETGTVGAPLTPFIQLNVSGTVPMKTKQVCKLIKVTYANGDSVASVTSSNQKAVQVSENNGTLTLKAQKATGVSTITVTLASNLKKTFKVKVQKTKVLTKKIKVAKKTVSFKGKGTFDLKTVLLPITTQEGKARYSLSKKGVVKVNGKGVITAKKKGNTVLTVKSGSKNVKVKITVK